MQIIPEIVLLDGRAVQMKRGQRDSAEDLGDPRALVERYAAAGAPLLHMVDANGAFDGHPAHLALVRELSRVIPIQLGGGLRTRQAIEAALASGVKRVVLGTAAARSPELLQAIAREQLVASVDVFEGKAVVSGWEDAASADPGLYAAQLVADGVDHILCTSVGRDGTETGPDLEALVKVSMCGGFVQAHGGVAGLHDLLAIANLPGIEAIVVGSALHHGKFTYEQACAAIADLDL